MTCHARSENKKQNKTKTKIWPCDEERYHFHALCSTSVFANKMKEKNKKKNKGIHWYKLGGRLLDYENNVMDKIDAIEFVRQWNLCYLWFSRAFLTSSVLSSEVQTDSDSLMKVPWADICQHAESASMLHKIRSSSLSFIQSFLLWFDFCFKQHGQKLKSEIAAKLASSLCAVQLSLTHSPSYVATKTCCRRWHPLPFAVIIPRTTHYIRYAVMEQCTRNRNTFFQSAVDKMRMMEIPLEPSAVVVISTLAMDPVQLVADQITPITLSLRYAAIKATCCLR